MSLTHRLEPLGHTDDGLRISHVPYMSYIYAPYMSLTYRLEPLGHTDDGLRISHVHHRSQQGHATFAHLTKKT